MADSTAAIVDFAMKSNVTVDEPALTFTLLDTIGVSLPGSVSELATVLRTWDAQHPMLGSSVVWGTTHERDASRAALLNGTFAHALDFDDASPSMPMHASAVLWPALLAVADERQCSYQEVLEAATVGQALFRAVSEALPMSVHYGRGWHSTATVGRVAGAMAVARLVGLPRSSALHAVGIAATMAAGSGANFGTMTKPLHAGQAAQDSVLAVQLAEAGMTAHTNQLDHAKGYFSLFGDPDRDRSDLEDRLAFWEQGWAKDVSLKRYPSCYGTHRAIDAALDIRQTLPDVSSIDAIDITVHTDGLIPLIMHFPQSELEAKFNLEYTVALAMTQGQVGLADFEPGWQCPPEVAQFMEKITVHTADAPPGESNATEDPFSHVSARTSDGQTYEQTVVFTRGDARNPMTPEELMNKVLACGAAAGFDSEVVGTLGRMILTGGSLDDVTRLLKELGR